MAADLLRSRLPPPWYYGVTSDGRVFFINEQTKVTTWLHPGRSHPVQSGHISSADLPRGWEKDYTVEGTAYFVDHVNCRTSFQHPREGEHHAMQDANQNQQMASVSPTAQEKRILQENRQNSAMERSSSTRKSGSRKKQKIIADIPTVKRTEEAPVSLNGWLYKQDSGGLKSWKKRWFVLADFCLFYYKGSEDDKNKTLGSILLPSYRISPCYKPDGINRKFAFKAEHENMRTYFFSATNQGDMNRWMHAMSMATVLQRNPPLQEPAMRGIQEPGMRGVPDPGLRGVPDPGLRGAPDAGQIRRDAGFKPIRDSYQGSEGSGQRSLTGDRLSRASTYPDSVFTEPRGGATDARYAPEDPRYPQNERDVPQSDPKRGMDPRTDSMPPPNNRFLADQNTKQAYNPILNQPSSLPSDSPSLGFRNGDEINRGLDPRYPSDGRPERMQDPRYPQQSQSPPQGMIQHQDPRYPSGGLQDPRYPDSNRSFQNQTPSQDGRQDPRYPSSGRPQDHRYPEKEGSLPSQSPSQEYKPGIREEGGRQQYKDPRYSSGAMPERIQDSRYPTKDTSPSYQSQPMADKAPNEKFRPDQSPSPSYDPRYSHPNQRQPQMSSEQKDLNRSQGSAHDPRYQSADRYQKQDYSPPYRSDAQKPGDLGTATHPSRFPGDSRFQQPAQRNSMNESQKNFATQGQELSGSRDGYGRSDPRHRASASPTHGRDTGASMSYTQRAVGRERPSSYHQNLQGGGLENVPRIDPMARLQEWQKQQSLRAVAGQVSSPSTSSDRSPSDATRSYDKTAVIRRKPDDTQTEQSRLTKEQHRRSGPFTYLDDTMGSNQQLPGQHDVDTIGSDRKHDTLSSHADQRKRTSGEATGHHIMPPYLDSKTSHYQNVPPAKPVRQNVDQDLPQRPPIPATYRGEYVRELAESKTPQTKAALLEASDMSMQRAGQPYYFQYPEDKQAEQRLSNQPLSDPSRHYEAKNDEAERRENWDERNSQEQRVNPDAYYQSRKQETSPPGSYTDVKRPIDVTDDETSYAQGQTTTSSGYAQGQTTTSSGYPQGQTTTSSGYPQGQTTTSSGYPQGQTTTSSGYPQGQTTTSSGYPQGQGTTNSGYPQSQGTTRSGYPQGQDTTRSGYPQSQDTSKSGYPQGQVTIKSGYPQGRDTIRSGYPQSEGSMRSGYPQGQDTTSRASYTQSQSTTARGYPQEQQPYPTSVPDRTTEGYTEQTIPPRRPTADVGVKDFYGQESEYGRKQESPSNKRQFGEVAARKERSRLERHIARSNDRLTGKGSLPDILDSRSPRDYDWASRPAGWSNNEQTRRSLDWEYEANWNNQSARRSLDWEVERETNKLAERPKSLVLLPTYRYENEDFETSQQKPEEGNKDKIWNVQKFWKNPRSPDDDFGAENRETWDSMNDYEMDRPQSFAEPRAVNNLGFTKLKRLDYENRISKSLGDLKLKNMDSTHRSAAVNLTGGKLPFEQPLRIETNEADPYAQKVYRDTLTRDEYIYAYPNKKGAPYNGEPPRRSQDPTSTFQADPRQEDPRMSGNPQGPTAKFHIATIKEDPRMADSEILSSSHLEKLRLGLESQRLRLSVQAGDLIGKSHEELVLLLIQLRRSQAKLEEARQDSRNKLDDSRVEEKDYKIKRKNSIGRLEDDLERRHEYYQTLRRQHEEIDKQIDVHKPLINLVNNMVTMGSLYGGDNLMLANQYKRHKLKPEQYVPPKEMIEFNRKHQEEKLQKELEDDIKQLVDDDDMDLVEKRRQLSDLDRLLQQKSFAVSSLQEDKELLEKALAGVQQQQSREDDPREQRKLDQQSRTIENELFKVRQQLADASKQWEEVAADNVRVEYDMNMIERSRKSGLRSQSSPTLGRSNSFRTRIKLEKELNQTQHVMEGLNKKGANISEVMKSLRHSTPDLSKADKKENAYMETDLDTMHSKNIAKEPEVREKDMPPEGVRISSISTYSSDNERSPFSPNNYNRPRSYSSELSPNSASARGYQKPMTHVHPQPLSGFDRWQSPQTSPHRSPETQPPYSGERMNNLHNGFSPEGSLDSPGDGYHDPESGSYRPMDINEADDNTKRFYGIQSREKPRAQTVRDVKKRESERKGRERRRFGEPDSSADEDMPPTNFRRSKSLPRSATLPVQTGPILPRSLDDSTKVSLKRIPSLSRDSQDRRSASERLFPGGVRQTNMRSEDHVRRISDIYTPKPFVVGGSKTTTPTFRSVMQFKPSTGSESEGRAQENTEAGTSSYLGYSSRSVTTVATVRPVQSSITPTYSPYEQHSIGKTSQKSDVYSAQLPWKSTLAVKPVVQDTVDSATPPPSDDWKVKARLRRTPRRQTISSSQPLKLEQNSHLKKDRAHSVAGDLISSRLFDDDIPDLVKAQSFPEPIFDLDLDTIDSMVLSVPKKVEIPERYIPDSDDDTDLTEEERLHRKSKGESIRRMLAAQSLQEWGKDELQGTRTRDIHYTVEIERQRREQVLDIRHALAQEVTQRSREVAALRKRTPSQSTEECRKEKSEDDMDENENTVLMPSFVDDRQSFYT